MTQANKKIIISKVRKNFLHKAPVNSQEEEEMIDELEPSPTASILPKDQIKAVFTALPFAEKGRKMYMEMEYYNLFSIIGTMSIKTNKHVTMVEMKGELNPNANTNPWRYTVKRLESYGDLQLALWAQRIRNYSENYEEAMGKYFEQLEDKIYADECENIRLQALKQKKIIEDNEEFHRASILLEKYRAYPTSWGFSEGFLREIGFTLEEFIVWSRKNGLCQYLDKASSINMNTIKCFLNALKSNFKSLQDGAEFESWIVGIDRKRRKVILKFITVLEPTSEGIIINIYYLMRKDKSENAVGDEVMVSDNMNLKMIKTAIEELEMDL